MASKTMLDVIMFCMFLRIAAGFMGNSSLVDGTV